MQKLNTTIIALTTAFAACAVDAADDQASAPAKSCVINAATGETACFGTFTDAIAMATDGRITDAPADAKASATDAALRARLDQVDVARPQTSFLLGTIFKDANFQGDSYTYVGSHACSVPFNASPEYEFGVMPSGFNDEVSSFSTYNNCFMVLYAEGGCMGRESDVNHAHSEAYVGDAMNDQASCVRFF